VIPNALEAAPWLLRSSSLRFVAALALLYLFHRKAGTMPEKDFYLLIILSVITGFLLIQIVMARIGRRRNHRRIQRGIAEYLALKSSGKRITKIGSVQNRNLRKVQ
jgi:hypothetical protein